MAARPLLIYDADCTFCTRCADWVRDRAECPVDVVAWQQVADLSAYGLTPEDATERAYWVDASGKVHGGVGAVARALEACGAAWWSLGRVMRTWPTTIPANLVYAVVARNRHLMPGGTEACRVEPDAPVKDLARG